MASGSEKRTIPRREFSQPVHLKCTREKSGQIELIEKFSQGIDINSNGLGILTDFPFKKGDVLKVTVPSKVDEALLPVFSRVAWARKQNDGFRVGLQFLS